MIARMMTDNRPVLRLLAFLAVAVLLLGVAADCGGEGGTYQGGGDSVPHYRR